MSRQNIQDFLQDAVSSFVNNEFPFGDQERVDDNVIDITTATYEDAGIMTRDKGLVLTVHREDGSCDEYQITIVRSN